MEKKEFRYEAVARKVEDNIRSLHLRPGERIPSVRKVSKELRASINTVFQAFAILEARGLILSKPRSGYIVNMPRTELRMSESKQVLTLPATVDMTTMATTMMKNAKEKGIVNFSILAPVNEHLPITKLNRIVTRCLYETRNDNYQYPLVEGNPLLLKQIALRSFDWPNSLDQKKLLITNGCMEAINLCLEAVTKPGDIVAIESPSYHGILQSLEQKGLKALEIGINPQTGLCLDTLKLALKKNKVAACIFMPRCHNPTGVSMPEGHKIELVNLLGKLKIPLIEDDALGELVYREGILPAKAYDRYDNVLYCSSFSKILAPGFRVGWVAAGKHYGAVEKNKYGSNMSTNGVLQAAIGKYLESGAYSTHIRKLRTALQTQMLKYIGAISGSFPADCKFSIPQGGLSIWVELPRGKDAFDLQRSALQKGIGICPGHIFSTSVFFHGYIRINFGPLWSGTTGKAIKTLGRLLKG